MAYSILDFTDTGKQPDKQKFEWINKCKLSVSIIFISYFSLLTCLKI